MWKYKESLKVEMLEKVKVYCNQGTIEKSDHGKKKLIKFLIKKIKKIIKKKKSVKINKNYSLIEKIKIC